MDKTFQHTVSWYQLSLKFHISMLLSALVEQREKIKSPTFLVSTQVIKWIKVHTCSCLIQTKVPHTQQVLCLKFTLPRICYSRLLIACR